MTQGYISKIIQDILLQLLRFNLVLYHIVWALGQLPTSNFWCFEAIECFL